MARTLWIDTLYDVSVANGAQFVQSLMTGQTFSETRLVGMTLMRTILRLDLAPVVMDSGEGSQAVDLGIAVGSQESVAASVVPDPDVAGNFPTRGWVYRGRWRVWGTAADRAVVVWRPIDEDIRARRKLENGEVYIVVDNNLVEGFANSIRLVGIIRQLWLVA